MPTTGSIERVLVLEPYGAASHRAWADGYARSSRFDVRTVVLPDERWRWRMRAGALTLARAVESVCTSGWGPDAILVSSMVDVAALLGLVRRTIGSVPVILYFHENQFAFPDPDVSGELRPAGEEFAATHVVSIAAADRVVFNSHHHRHQVEVGIEALFDSKPEMPPVSVASASVIPVGVDAASLVRRPTTGRSPLILWNHRWDHDKDPQAFFRTLHRIEDMDWRLAVVGGNNRIDPQEFDAAQTRFADRIVEWGHLDRPRYVELLGSADVVCSTAVHEYFGIAMVEAAIAGAVPLLPNRLSYPEVIPPAHHPAVLYEPDELVDRLRSVLRDPVAARSAVRGLSSDLAGRFDWSVVAAEMDAVVDAALEECQQ